MSNKDKGIVQRGDEKNDNSRNPKKGSATRVAVITKAGAFSALSALPGILASDTQAWAAHPIVEMESSRASAAIPLTPKQGSRTPPKPDFLRRRDDYRLLRQRGTPDIVAALTGGSDNCPGATITSGRYTAQEPFRDSGDTTGGNDTVTRLAYDYNYTLYFLNVNAQDHVYTFSITSRGEDPEIRVTTPSPSYDPAIYILDGLHGGCPSGTGQIARLFRYSNRSGTTGPEVFDAGELNRIPLNIPLHLLVDSPAANHAGPYTISMKDVTLASPVPRRKFDFDRDGRADLYVFRPSSGFWYTNSATPPGLFTGTQFGISTDRITPADYDGDGKTDVAVFRDGVWYWINSSNGTTQAFQFGLPGDIPQSADFDGDGRAELAVFRAGTWFTYNLANNQSGGLQFGLPGDKPVVGDYDGDGRADHAVFRNGVWYFQRSSRGFLAIDFGRNTDILVPSDFTGDDQTDLAVFRDGTWLVQEAVSTDRPFQFQFGLAGDIPVPADYGGYGFTQAAVFRQGIWYVRDSFNRTLSYRFGLADDRPIQSAYQP